MSKTQTTKPSHSRIVDTAIVLDAAIKHKKSTETQLKTAKTAFERAEDHDAKAQVEEERAAEDHRQALRLMQEGI